MAKANRLSINFNVEDKDQEKAVEFLDKCGYKKNKIIAIMVSEFIAKYELDVDKLNPGEMKEFLSGYEYIKQSHANMQIYPQTTTQAPNMEERKEKDKSTMVAFSAPKGTDNGIKKVSVMDSDRADLALSAFGL